MKPIFFKLVISTYTMSGYKRKTWAEKLNSNRKPLIEKVEREFAGVKPGQIMLIPTPKIVDAYIRQIPKGVQVATETLSKDLAAEYHAEITCPLTTGIFIRIAAEAAYEEYEKGKPLNQITPFWRVIRETSPTAKKLTFGTSLLKEQRKKEGIM